MTLFRTKKNSDKFSLAINSIYSVIYRLLNVFFPLITATYAARVILPAGVGKTVYAENIAQYFLLIAALGIPNYGIREIARRRGNAQSTDKVFSELFLINACSTIICSAAYYIWICASPLFEQNRLLYAIAGMKLVFNLINVDWFYYGKEEYRFVAIRSFIVKLVSLVLMFVLVRDVDDYLMFALVHSIAIVGNHILNIFSLKGRVHFTSQNLNISRHLKPVFILLASSISIELYTMLDTTMLGFWCDDSVVGYYNNAIRLARILNTTITSIAVVLLPRLSYYYEQGDQEKVNEIAQRVFKILVTLTLPAAAGVFLLSDDIIILLFGNAFIPAIGTLRILTIIIIAISLSNFFGAQILMTFGQEKKLLISVACGAGINIILNSFLIGLFQQNGAAAASAASEILVLLATWLFARKYVQLRTKAAFWITLVLSIVTMSAAVYAVTLLRLPLIAELLVAIIIGILVFAVTGILTKNEGILQIYSIAKELLARTFSRKKKA